MLLVQVQPGETKQHLKCHLPQTHHDDADTDSNSADDVQFVVEHLVDGDWTALSVNTF